MDGPAFGGSLPFAANNKIRRTMDRTGRAVPAIDMRDRPRSGFNFGLGVGLGRI